MNPVARLCLVSLVVAMGCGQAAGGDDLSVREDFVGDTLVLTSVGAPPVDTIPHIDIVWRSEGLEQPQSMVAAGSGLFVGDRRGVHFVGLPDHTTWTRNRAGDGPGEFRSIGGVGVFGASALARSRQLCRTSIPCVTGRHWFGPKPGCYGRGLKTYT